MPFEEYLQKAVLSPLGMEQSCAARRPQSCTGRSRTWFFARELLAPTLVAPETFAEATSVQFPGLAGVIPDLGRFDPNDWGLGFELKGSKQYPTSRARSPRRAPSGTGAAAEPSSGSTRIASSRWESSPTSTSATGRRRPGLA